MNEPNELHPFLEAFRHDHVELLTHLSGHLNHVLGARDSAAEIAALRGFFNYAAGELHMEHKLREELFLFPAVAQKSLIRGGGPLCTLYFDRHLKQPPLARAASVCGRPRSSPSAKNIPDHWRWFYEMQSPTCIPLEDHLAEKEILDFARGALATPAEGMLPEIRFAAHVYFDLLKGHSQKEDNCLIPMCHSLVSYTEWSEWSMRADAWLKQRRSGIPLKNF